MQTRKAWLSQDERTRRRICQLCQTPNHQLMICMPITVVKNINWQITYPGSNFCIILYIILPVTVFPFSVYLGISHPSFRKKTPQPTFQQLINGSDDAHNCDTEQERQSRELWGIKKVKQTMIDILDQHIDKDKEISSALETLILGYTISPFKVAQCINFVTYWLQIPPHDHTHPVFHVSVL